MIYGLAQGEGFVEETGLVPVKGLVQQLRVLVHLDERGRRLDLVRDVELEGREVVLLLGQGLLFIFSQLLLEAFVRFEGGLALQWGVDVELMLIEDVVGRVVLLLLYHAVLGAVVKNMIGLAVDYSKWSRVLLGRHGQHLLDVDDGLGGVRLVVDYRCLIVFNLIKF